MIKKCSCGSVQFKYNGDCLSCGLSQEQGELIKNEHAVVLGKLGGSKTSAKKKISSKKNGRKGGRPKVL